MVLCSLCFAFGVWLLQQQAALPAPAWAALLILLALLAWRTRGRPRSASFAVLAFGLGFFYASFSAQHRLSDTLPAAWQGRDIQVVGVAANLPRQRSYDEGFAFDVERVLTPGAHVPAHILLAVYNGDTPAPVRAGERWRFTIRLKQPHGESDPGGFDFEGWMLERDLRAAGYVRKSADNARLKTLVYSPGYLIQHLRELARERLQRVLGNAPYAGVITALAIGDQGSIPADQWQVFTRTGVNHLMAISGLHISMLALLAFGAVYALWRRVPRLALAFPARKAAAVAGLLAALLYALLCGFSIPAQRTVYMLATVAAALLLSRRIAPAQLLSLALFVVLLADPWAVIAPGFWLSFGAVALILYVSANRLGRPNWLAGYGRVQWAMLAGMVPALLALFQQISLVAPIANAFAIPLVSFIVAPLAILGTVIPIDAILWLAHGAMALGMAGLNWLAQLPDAVWQQHAPPVWSVVLGVAGALWLLLPRGFPARWLGFAMLLPLFLVMPETPAPGALRLVVFDVGQGLSVLAETHNHALLYDTGPDYPGPADSGNRIIIPALHTLGVMRLSELVLSHNDADHTGGALSVLAAEPVGWVDSSLPKNSAILAHAPDPLRCVDGQQWQWDGVRFQVLHPAPASYADGNTKKNNRGCTIRITAGKYSVLLPADNEKPSERRLLRVHPDQLAATLLVAPHHGSLTSSTPAFVQAVHPRYTVFAVGYRNRFRHPRPAVVARYKAAGSKLLRSDTDGAVIVDMGKSGVHVTRWRRAHARYWMQGLSPS